MNLLALMTGIDIPIPELQATIHPPTLKEISLVGEEDFFAGVACLCVNRNLFESQAALLETTTNFQIFMAILQSPQEKNKRRQVEYALTLLFPFYKIAITPRSIILSKSNEVNVTIDESNFEILQTVIRKICCLEGRGNVPEYKPQGSKAKEIAEKLMRGRQRVAEIKEKEGQGKGSQIVQYISILTIAIPSMSLSDIINLTLFQFYDLIERYSKYMNWDIDIRARIAGAKGESEPDNWMDNIH